MLIREKVAQAQAILNECRIDCWITFVRESSMCRDPMLPFLTKSDLTWHSAFVITRSGETCAIIGDLERPTVEDLGVYHQVIGYVEGIREPFVELMQRLSPKSIALNYSKSSEISDGLTHGMYLTILELLSEAGLEDRVTSAEPIVSKLRARKSDYEIACIQQAIDHTLEIYSRVSTFIAPGRSEEDIASFVSQEVEARNLDFAWEESHCPAVFTGPDTAGAHYHPTDRLVLPGHVLNMDFGVKVDGYCSDLQRTFYILEEGQTGAPREVVHGFETIIEAIELSRQALKPGVLGHQVDAVSRSHLKSKGYEEFPHGLGHQVGRFAHDGTALLGPPWEKYANKPFEPIEPGMVFTIEPRLKVPERGTVTVEEMVVVTNEGARFLSEPQTELILIG